MSRPAWQGFPKRQRGPADGGIILRMAALFTWASPARGARECFIRPCGTGDLFYAYPAMNT
jgi:hypothetical protein